MIPRAKVLLLIGGSFVGLILSSLLVFWALAYRVVIR